MKLFLKKIISLIISFLHLFYNLKTANYLNKIDTSLRSMWLRCEFKHIGNSVYFMKGVHILGAKCIILGSNVSFGKGCILTAWENYLGKKLSPHITIGSNCNFGDYNHITATNNITIGDGVLTGRWVTITDNSHGQTDYQSLQCPPITRNIYSKGPVKIGNNVWIGDKATILPGVTIGDGAIIGANSLVTKDIPPYCVAGGNPAIILKENKTTYIKDDNN